MNTESAMEIATNIPGTSMAMWSEDKKKDFAQTFEQRSKASRYLLLRTAYHVYHYSKNRKILSDKHGRYVKCDDSTIVESLYDTERGRRTHGGQDSIGGRPESELEEIAKQRAKQLLEELPPLQKALEIVQPDVARKMAKRDHLITVGQDLMAHLERNSKTIKMSEVDEKLTIGEFLAQVQELEKQRTDTIKALDKIGKEGCKIDAEISQALYAGIPGLSDAVLKVINQHTERAKVMGETCRRVGELVLFGDSDAALSLLQTFENDEAKVSDEVRTEFSGMLEKLKLARKKKALSKGGK
jgi:hypothetical protein